jgi:hypothetical protein
MQQTVEFIDPNIEPVVLQYPDFQVFSTATEHAYGCRCWMCREWWLSVGPEDNGKFGPFGMELWEEYADKHCRPVRDIKFDCAVNAFFCSDVNVFPEEFTIDELEERVRLMIAEMEQEEAEYASRQ